MKKNQFTGKSPGQIWTLLTRMGAIQALEDGFSCKQVQEAFGTPSGLTYAAWWRVKELRRVKRAS